MTREITAIILSEPGRKRGSFKAILSSFPFITQTLVADDAASIDYKILSPEPDLVLIVLEASYELLIEEIKKIKQYFPNTNYLVVTNFFLCKQRIELLELATVLDWGFNARTLYETVQYLLTPKE